MPSQHQQSATTRPPTTSELLRFREGENFPVALWLLPKIHRRHLMAVYVFARFVDYIGDEAPGDRSTLLHKVSRDLDKLYAGHQPPEQVLRTLGATITECHIPREPFDDLIAANNRDQRLREYQSHAQLLDYCTLSANPVGRIVLHVFGQHNPVNEKLSDKICTALQLLEHLQDIAEDARVGRIYLPADDRARFGVAEPALTTAPADVSMRALIAFETQRAVRLLDDGEPLLGRLHGAAKVAIAGYLAGGRATARAIAAARFDTISTAVRPAKTATIGAAVRGLIGARG